MTVHIVRHASAGTSNHGDPADLLRPLDSLGRQHAAMIAELLAHAPITRMLASPAVRCTETLEPLAKRIAIAVEQAPALIEGTDIEVSWALLEECASTSIDTDVVLCSHGDVIPELISRARARGMSVPGRSGYSKGSIWSLEFDGEFFTSGTYLSVRAEAPA